MIEDAAKKKGLDVRDQVLSGKQLDVRDQVTLENQNIKPLNSIANITRNNQSMTNIEFLELVNQIRVEHGESKIRLNDLNVRIVDELEGEHYETFVVTNPNKTTSFGIILNLEQCILMGMRETKGVRRSVVQYIKNLQVQNVQPVIDLNNPEFLRQALLGYTEKVIELEHKVQKLEPKAQALDDIAATTSTFCIRDAAKTVGVSEKVFIQFLLNQNWVYRSKDGYNTLVAYGKRINQKVMAEKVTRVIETSKGPQVFTQARVTSKGLTRLAAMVRDAGLVEGVAA